MDKEEWKSCSGTGSWRQRKEGKKISVVRRKENKCSSSSKFSSRNSGYFYSVCNQTSIKSLFFLPDKTSLFSGHEQNEFCLRSVKNILTIKNLYGVKKNTSRVRIWCRGNNEAAVHVLFHFHYCAQLCLGQGWGHGWHGWVCAQHSNISAGFWGRMTFIYLIFYQIREFVLPFCLQRLALLSICERFFCFSSQEISSLEGLDACLLSLSEFGQLKLWLLSPAVSPATHSREEQMMAKCSEQPSNNWKDLPVLIWQKAVSFSVVWQVWVPWFVIWVCMS